MGTTPGSSMTAGWYSDPWYSGQYRFWSGSGWTADTFTDLSGSAVTATPFALTYGPPPSEPADPSPPPPAWHFRPQAGIAPPAPAPVTATTAAANRTPLWIAAAVVAFLVVLGAGVALVRMDSGTTPRATSTSSQSPRPSPSPEATGPTDPTTPSPPAPSQPGPSGSAAPSPPGQSIEATLANLVVRQQDVPNRFTVAPIPGGRSVAGGPTLDLCGGDYPSEDLRVGRLQVAAKDRQGTTTLSTEAVQYESDAATAQAFAEVRSSTADCQFDVSMDLSQGTITSSSITADIDRSWQRTAGVDRLAYRVNETEQLSGEESSTVVVYLKRGPLFIGLYFPEPGGRQMPVEGRDRIPTIVKLFEERLLNTPPGSSSETDRGGTGGGGQGDAGGGVGA